MKILFPILLLLTFSPAQNHSPAYLSAEKKLAAMDAYSAQTSSSGLVTVLSDAEINAYFAEGGVKLADGVSDVHFDDQPSSVHVTAKVDFDQVTAKARSGNPLLAFFTGVHTVEVSARAAAVHGRAHISVETVSLDGNVIPRTALEFFVVKYLQPKYPEADLDAVFGLPNRVDSATVGDHQITFAQR